MSLPIFSFPKSKFPPYTAKTDKPGVSEVEDVLLKSISRAVLGTQLAGNTTGDDSVIGDVGGEGRTMATARRLNAVLLVVTKLIPYVRPHSH